jgi:NitT/TauT family transport system substrate-binding protein
VLAVLLTGCAKSNGESTEKDYKSTVIRVQYTNAYGSAVPQILMFNKYLENSLPEGVTVEWVNINSGTDVRDALVAGQIDIATMATPSVIAAIENGLPLEVISGSAVLSGILYSHNPEIRGLADIKAGDKVSLINIGNSQHLALMLACKEQLGAAGKLSDNLVSMQYADVFASLASSDELDCAVMGFPNLKKADAIETLEPILDLTPILREYNIGNFTIVNEKFLDENPYLIEVFSKAFNEAVEYINQESAAAAQLLADFYGEIDAADIVEQLKSAPPKLEISESAYDKVAALMYEVGMLDHAPKKFSELPNYASIPKTK